MSPLIRRLMATARTPIRVVRRTMAPKAAISLVRMGILARSGIQTSAKSAYFINGGTGDKVRLIDPRTEKSFGKSRHYVSSALADGAGEPLGKGLKMRFFFRNYYCTHWRICKLRPFRRRGLLVLCGGSFGTRGRRAAHDHGRSRYAGKQPMGDQRRRHVGVPPSPGPAVRDADPRSQLRDWGECGADLIRFLCLSPTRSKR